MHRCMHARTHARMQTHTHTCHTTGNMSKNVPCKDVSHLDFPYKEILLIIAPIAAWSKVSLHHLPHHVSCLSNVCTLFCRCVEPFVDLNLQLNHIHTHAAYTHTDMHTCVHSSACETWWGEEAVRQCVTASDVCFGDSGKESLEPCWLRRKKKTHQQYSWY